MNCPPGSPSLQPQAISQLPFAPFPIPGATAILPVDIGSPVQTFGGTPNALRDASQAAYAPIGVVDANTLSSLATFQALTVGTTLLLYSSTHLCWEAWRLENSTAQSDGTNTQRPGDYDPTLNPVCWVWLRQPAQRQLGCNLNLVTGVGTNATLQTAGTVPASLLSVPGDTVVVEGSLDTTMNGSGVSWGLYFGGQLAARVSLAAPSLRYIRANLTVLTGGTSLQAAGYSVGAGGSDPTFINLTGTANPVNLAQNNAVQFLVTSAGTVAQSFSRLECWLQPKAL